jgi:hypothetical protein
VLAVVKHYEHAPLAHVGRDRLLRGAGRTALDAEDRPDRVRYQRSAGEPGELD